MSEGILPVPVNNSPNNSNSGSNLPRGLMSKSGLPFNPNQRLPSLRSSLSKPSLLFQSSASFTHNHINSSPSTGSKSPITSRRLHETVNGSSDCMVTPTKRSPGEGKGFTNNGVKGKNGLDPKGSTSSGRGRRQNQKKTKKFVQLESTVFTGASRSPIKKLSESSKKSRGKKSPVAPPPVDEQSEDSIEPTYIEGKLYQDDFINPSGDDKDDNCELLPQGWEALSLPIVKEPVISDQHWLSPDPLRDKLILFQLPKMLENQSNMRLGKLRIYESGKVELVNHPSDLTFEVTKAGHSEQILRSVSPSIPSTSANLDDDLADCQITVKSESTKPDYIEPKLNRELVVYSGRNLISLGKLEPDAAIVIPKLFTSS